MRGKAFLMAVRPDLATMETRNVQARVTVGICDERGIPRSKNRFFVVTARVARQVQMGQSAQDRSDPHPDFRTWNFDGRNFKGMQSIRLRLQHADIEPAYNTACLCYRAPGAPKPPGKSPYCKSSDMETASRWDGDKFAPIPCERDACELRQPHDDGRGNKTKPAKTLFSLVGRLDEPGFPSILVSVATGSDYNFAQFIGLCEGIERQWADMCSKAMVTLPLSWYGLPLRLTVYESTGDGSRFPRVDYTLDCSIEDMFQASIAFYQRMQGLQGLASGAQPLALPPASEMTLDHEALDAQEVLNPGEAQADRRPPAAERFDAATRRETNDEPAPLIVRCKAAKFTQLPGLLKEAVAAGDLDSTMVLLEKSAKAYPALVEAKRAALADIWRPLVSDILEVYPDAHGLFDVLGLIEPPAPTDEPVPEDDGFPI